MHTDTFVTLSDLIALGTIAESAMKCAKVARIMPDSGDIVYGISRHFMNGGASDNLIEQRLRVTTKMGFEAFWPVRELVDEVKEGNFAIYDWS